MRIKRCKMPNAISEVPKNDIICTISELLKSATTEAATHPIENDIKKNNPGINNSASRNIIANNNQKPDKLNIDD